VNRAAVAAAAALFLSISAPGSPLDGVPENAGRSAGLQWRFVRIKYHYDPAALRALQLDVDPRCDACGVRLEALRASRCRLSERCIW